MVDLLQRYFQAGIRHSILFVDGLVGEIKQNSVITCIFSFPFGVCLVDKYKADKNASPQVYLMLIYVLYHLIILLVDTILLVQLKIEYDLP